MSEREEDFELDSHALAMIAAYRQEESLPADVRERVWDRVEGDVGEPSTSGSAIKWGVVLLAAAAVIAVAVVGSQVMVPEEESVDSQQQAPYGVSGEAPEEPAVHVERTRPRAVVPPAAKPEAPEVDAPAVAPAEASEPPSSKPRARRAPRDRAPDVVEPAPIVEASPVDTLAEETRMLERARKAVFSSRPNDALATLAEYERKFPTPRLGPERGALRAIALCDLGRSEEGSKAAEAFLAAHSGHMLAKRVREACHR